MSKVEHIDFSSTRKLGILNSASQDVPIAPALAKIVAETVNIRILNRKSHAEDIGIRMENQKFHAGNVGIRMTIHKMDADIAGIRM